MKIFIFFDWGKRLDAIIAPTPGRKIPLLLEHFSGHSSPEYPFQLSSNAVKFVTAYTALQLQRVDAGLVSSLKRQYRTLQ